MLHSINRLLKHMESLIVEPAILYLKLDSIVNENPNTLHQAMRNVERSGSQIQNMQNHQYELSCSPIRMMHCAVGFSQGTAPPSKGKVRRPLTYRNCKARHFILVLPVYLIIYEYLRWRMDLKVHIQPDYLVSL